MAHLANIEKGAVPKRGAVLDRAWKVISESLNDERRPQGAAVQKPGRQARHGTG
jgi:hypothetical protein